MLGNRYLFFDIVVNTSNFNLDQIFFKASLGILQKLYNRMLDNRYLFSDIVVKNHSYDKYLCLFNIMTILCFFIGSIFRLKPSKNDFKN